MNVVFRAAAAYWILLFALRFLGRRTSSQLAPLDLVVLFLVAGTTITGVLGDERSVTAAVSALITFGLMHRLVAWLKARSPRFGRIVDGTPVIIFEDGAFQEKRMRQLNIQQSDIMYAVRQRGLREIAQVRYAIAERDGKISIIDEE
jgi:uncharacterized membrane protein YcaP (DUF421 family)